MYEQKDPAVLFYTKDFLVSTIFMTNEQVGAYIKLLCLQHQDGHLKPEVVKAISGNDETVLAKFKQDEAGLCYNERMDFEITRRRKTTDSSRNNGKLGGRPTKKPNENPQVIKSKPNENPSANANENANRTVKKKKFIPPTVEEVAAYCSERGNSIDPKHFVDYYAANDWKKKDGTPVTNWKQAVITWENTEKKNERVHRSPAQSASKWNLNSI